MTTTDNTNNNNNSNNKNNDKNKDNNNSNKDKKVFLLLRRCIWGRAWVVEEEDEVIAVAPSLLVC